jgi:primase-polymerase (primpol)-like protein
VTTIASLAPHERWVGWQRETRNGLLTKVPYDPRSGKQAATDNPNTWATYD